MPRWGQKCPMSRRRISQGNWFFNIDQRCSNLCGINYVSKIGGILKKSDKSAKQILLQYLIQYVQMILIFVVLHVKLKLEIRKLLIAPFQDLNQSHTDRTVSYIIVSYVYIILFRGDSIIFGFHEPPLASGQGLCDIDRV